MPTQSSKKSNASKKADPTPRRPRSTKKSPAADTSPDPASPAALRAVQPGDEKYAPTAWGSGTGSGPQDLEMPSGQVALVRRPGMQQLVLEGVLHNMDNLTALVDKKHLRKGQVGKPSDAINIEALMGDTEALASILHTVDRVVCAVVIRPHVEMTPADVTRRVPGVIYTDTVDIQDKMFIFNWVMGGSKDLESFRRESEEIVGSLAIGDAVESEAE